MNWNKAGGFWQYVVFTSRARTVDTLQSVELTRLPSVTLPSAESNKGTSDRTSTKPSVEYSSREVSSAPLLTSQLVQAHNIFLLHHGPSLSDLFVRLNREKFCSALERFWSRFARSWDVLLHGNPAADVFGDIKLASGGELGFGVGEEEWGSGERDVLEDLARRTEGLVDLVVSRFGEPAKAEASDETLLPGYEALPWMGSGTQPRAADGIVFSGVGRISRPSLRNVSLWMRQIYTYGEFAYGIRDNPLRERRKRRRRNVQLSPSPDPESKGERAPNGGLQGARGSQDLSSSKLRLKSQHGSAGENANAVIERVDEPFDVSTLPPDRRPQIHERTASQDHTLLEPKHTPRLHASDQPGIPPPIVNAANAALEKATKKADQNLKQDAQAEADEPGTTWGVPDQYMKYLTFGLSEIGKSKETKRPTVPRRTSMSSSGPAKPAKREIDAKRARPATVTEADEDETPSMTRLDPMPDDESATAKFAQQRRQENRGHFVIGLKGDLDNLPADVEADMTDGSLYDDSGGARIVLRTVQVQLAPSIDVEPDSDAETPDQALERRAEMKEPVDPSTRNTQRLRVLIYVHRPFMYCLLFENRTSSLAYSGFYRTLHQSLVPIHKPLLSSTSAAKVVQRIEQSHVDQNDDTASVRSAGSNKLPSKGGAANSEARPIFDLIYDPRLLTVHTSIPNIPEPGTPAAEGLGLLVAGSGSDALPSGWTRLDALNVHSQVLNTVQSVKGRRAELERTSKTSRGWWVVWMRVPPSEPSSGAGAAADRPVRDSTETTTASSTAISHSDKDADIAKSEPYSKDANVSKTTLATFSSHMPSTTRVGIPPDMTRTAFLVRKSNDAATVSAKASVGSRAANSMWSTLTLRPAAVSMGMVEPTEEEKTGGSAAGWGPAALGSGIGIDARRYVEGLLSLNR
jgi:hypothetical protein